LVERGGSNTCRWQLCDLGRGVIDHCRWALWSCGPVVWCVPYPQVLPSLCATSLGILLSSVQLLSSCMCEHYDGDYDPSDNGLPLPMDDACHESCVTVPVSREPSVNQRDGDGAATATFTPEAPGPSSGDTT
jgi:hypothetical protein